MERLWRERKGESVAGEDRLERGKNEASKEERKRKERKKERKEERKEGRKREEGILERGLFKPLFTGAQGREALARCRDEESLG